jgi:hypothetical protein
LVSGTRTGTTALFGSIRATTIDPLRIVDAIELIDR